jgi:hypothetical protein
VGERRRRLLRPSGRRGRVPVLVFAAGELHGSRRRRLPHRLLHHQRRRADRLMSARTNKLVASTTIDLVLAVLMEDGRHGIYVYMSPVEKSSVGSTFYKLFLLKLLYSNRQTVEIIFTVNFLCEPPVKNVSCIYSGCASRKFSKSLVPILFNRRRQAAQILHDYSLSSPPAIDPSPSSVFMT